MPSTYIIKHPTTGSSGSPTPTGPWIYIAAQEVTEALTNNVMRVTRPDADQRYRRRSTREKKIVIRAELAGKTGEFGVDSGSGITGTGKLMQEKLEEAWQNWKTDGAIRIVLGTDSAGGNRNFDGLIENVTFAWSPAKGDDEAEVRGATINFLSGDVG